MERDSADPVRVMIVAASPVHRAGLESLVAADRSLKVAGVSSNSIVVRQQAHDLSIEVLLLDETGARDTNGILRIFSDSSFATVLLTDDTDRSRTVLALRAGARSVLPRDAGSDEIIAAIHAAAAGLSTLRPEVLLDLTTRVPSASDESELPLEQLTDREVEVLNMISEGLGNKGIAKRLGISEHTVKFHISSVLSKLGVASRTEAVTHGIRSGLIVI
jgi:DNA-binding NarL/FixJ family response regulator